MTTYRPYALPPENTPTHVAIIMDGNGRWANARGLQRHAGHRRGVHAVRSIVETASTIGVRWLTLYTFSTENWNRPITEIDALMQMLARYLRRETESLRERGVRVRTIGDRDRLPEVLQRQLDLSEKQTAKGTKLDLILALSYSGRQEIVGAAKKLVFAALQGEVVANNITEQDIATRLSNPSVPDPDVIIRTGGDKRVSNFLLWQLAYSELIFRSEYWPDFTAESFVECIDEYRQRERRYGEVSGSRPAKSYFFGS